MKNNDKQSPQQKTNAKLTWLFFVLNTFASVVLGLICVYRIHKLYMGEMTQRNGSPILYESSPELFILATCKVGLIGIMAIMCGFIAVFVCKAILKKEFIDFSKVAPNKGK